jgi:MFS family permease
MDLIGRRRILSLGSLLFSIAMVNMVYADSYTSLLLSRLFQGMSIGLLLTVIPVYVSETSLINLRGRAMGVFQISLVFGIFFANLIATIFADKYGWRVIFVSVLPMSMLLFVLSLLTTKSPSWLNSVGRRYEAETANQELFGDAQQLPAIKHDNSLKDFLVALKDKVNFGYLMLICALAMLNGLVGINMFISYGPTIFGQLLPSVSISHAITYGTILTLVNLVATLIGVVFVDSLGRRKLTILGLTISVLGTIVTVIGLVNGNAYMTLIAMLAVVFGGAFGPGVCIWLILSEILPTKLRAFGMSMALVSKALLDSVFGSFFLVIAGGYGYQTIFAFMGCSMLLFIFLVYKFLPEMANRQLQE